MDFDGFHLFLSCSPRFGLPRQLQESGRSSSSRMSRREKLRKKREQQPLRKTHQDFSTLAMKQVRTWTGNKRPPESKLNLIISIVVGIFDMIKISPCKLVKAIELESQLSQSVDSNYLSYMYIFTYPIDFRYLSQIFLAIYQNLVLIFTWYSH